MWVAAAMHAGRRGRHRARHLQELGHDLGTAIDRAGGIDAVNDFYWNVADMDHSITANWSFGDATRVEPGPHGRRQLLHAAQRDPFLTKLDRGEIRRADGRAPHVHDVVAAERLRRLDGTLLPEAARRMMYKAGWLPPPDYAEYSTLNEVGIIQVPAASATRSRPRASRNNYGARRAWWERASCVVYRAVAKDSSIGCRD